MSPVKSQTSYECLVNSLITGFHYLRHLYQLHTHQLRIHAPWPPNRQRRHTRRLSFTVCDLSSTHTNLYNDDHAIASSRSVWIELFESTYNPSPNIHTRTRTMTGEEEPAPHRDGHVGCRANSTHNITNTERSWHSQKSRGETDGYSSDTHNQLEVWFLKSRSERVTS